MCWGRISKYLPAGLAVVDLHGGEPSDAELLAQVLVLGKLPTPPQFTREGQVGQRYLEKKEQETHSRRAASSDGRKQKNHSHTSFSARVDAPVKGETAETMSRDDIRPHAF